MSGRAVNSGRSRLLAESRLGHDLGPEAFRDIEDEIRYVELDASAVLVAHGDAAEEMYVLLDGRLEVTIPAGDGQQTLTTLGPGSTVGEIALLAGDRRSATVRACEPSHVAVISAEGFRRLLADHPEHAEVLAREAAQRLRETQLVGQLNQLFGHLEAEVLATIEDLIEWMPVRAGTRLFSEGDEGDAAYLVVTGRLRVFRSGDDGAEIAVGEIGRAEMAGEMALLEATPRNATVYAVRDSQLVRFSRRAFTELVDRYPVAGLLVARTVLRRTRERLGKDAPEHLSVVVVGTGEIDGDAFGRELAGALGGEARYVDGRTIDEDLGVAGISDVRDDEVGAIRLAYWLEELQERHGILVYGVDDGWSEWSRRALRWSDRVLVVADAGADPSPGELEAELWGLVERQKHPKASLALIHPADTVLPAGTARWLDHRSLTSHHHVKRGDTDSMERLARLLSGSGTSLVLGGGGARGFAHIGVLTVLEEQRVPVDMVGGSSIGAIMAIGPGLGYTAERLRAMALDQFRRIFDYTLPSASVLKGKRIADKLEALVGGVDISDLWIPYFCVSTNLTTAGAHYHERGDLVEAIRASIAIPGVLPPVPHEGELLVDGGILENVPVDEMRRRNPTGRILAVDVAPAAGPAAESDYGLSLSGFRALLGRIRGTSPPGLLTTLVRSSMIASVRDRDRVVEDGIADLYLDVTVDGVGLLDFGAARRVAETAEATTRPVLDRWLRQTETADIGYIRTGALSNDAPERPRRRTRGGTA